MTALPIVSVGFDGSLAFTSEQPLSRRDALKLAMDLIHGHAESRGLDAVQGVAKDMPDGAYIFIFNEFQQVTDIMAEVGPRTCLKWFDEGFEQEVVVHPDTEMWWYVPAQS